MQTLIRPANKNDLTSFVKIINHYIEHTAITFDTEPYSEQSRLSWFQQFQQTGPYQCLTATQNNEIIGYACSSPFRPKNAFITSVEVSIYLSPHANGLGVGKQLYQTLFEKLSDAPVHRAYALITLPNERSIGLHNKFGFNQIGVLSDAGHKLGQYHSIALMEKQL